MTDTPYFPFNQNINNNYNLISKNFLEKFCGELSLGIYHAQHYYGQDTLISIRISQLTGTVLYEIIGYNRFRQKLSDMNIHSIRFYNIVQTNQPFGANNVIINFYGKAEINGIHYNVICMIIVKNLTNSPQILNQILQISV